MPSIPKDNRPRKVKKGDRFFSQFPNDEYKIQIQYEMEKIAALTASFKNLKS